MDGIAYGPALILSVLTIFIWNLLTGKKKAAAEISDEEKEPVEESGQSFSENEESEYPGHSTLGTTAPAVSISRYHPLWRAFGFGAAVLVVVTIGATTNAIFFTICPCPRIQ